MLKAVRTQAPPEVPDDFAMRVLRQIHREPAPRPVSFADQLSALFPKLAFATLTMIAVCIVGDLILGDGSSTEIDGIRQISDEWFLPTEGI